MRQQFTHFAFDYTFWLNLVFGLLALWLWSISRKHPMHHHHHAGHGHHHSGAA